MLRDNITGINIDTTSSVNLVQNGDGIILFYDTSRNKMLSITRETMSFGLNHRNIMNHRWLQTVSKIPSNILGYKVPRNATITSITIQTENLVSYAKFNIRTNGSLTNLHTTNLVTDNKIIQDNLNYNINKGDYLQLFMSVISGNVDYPLTNIEIAWR